MGVPAKRKNELPIPPEELVEDLAIESPAYRRRKIVQQYLTIGLSAKEIAEKMWLDPSLRDKYIPSQTFQACYTLIRSDIMNLVNEIGLETPERTSFARWQYMNRQEAIFKKAFRDANNAGNSEYFRVQSLKVAADAARAVAKVQGVDVERPLKIQIEEKWEVFIDDWGNAQRRELREEAIPVTAREIGESDDSGSYSGD